MSVSASVHSSAARSRSLKNGVSRHAERAYNRCSVSPAARASLVCMSMQYAQPLSCEARIFTSSSSAGSRPESFTAFCRPNNACATGGAAFNQSRRFMVTPLLLMSPLRRSRILRCDSAQGEPAQLVGIQDAEHIEDALPVGADADHREQPVFEEGRDAGFAVDHDVAEFQLVEVPVEHAGREPGHLFGAMDDFLRGL